MGKILARAKILFQADTEFHNGMVKMHQLGSIPGTSR
jgi:hypothetical protein